MSLEDTKCRMLMRMKVMARPDVRLVMLTKDDKKKKKMAEYWYCFHSVDLYESVDWMLIADSGYENMLL